MLECIITLVKYNRTSNGADIEEVEDDSYDLVATERSVGMRESYEALSVGIKPERVFVISDYLDYEGQKTLFYNDERYEIIRTFRKDTDELEITVTR